MQLYISGPAPSIWASGTTEGPARSEPSCDDSCPPMGTTANNCTPERQHARPHARTRKSQPRRRMGHPPRTAPAHTPCRRPCIANHVRGYALSWSCSEGFRRTA